MKIGATDDLEFGYSKKGMSQLNDSLEKMLYDEICDALKKMQKDVEDALDKCWQGKSHDLFVKDFEARITEVKAEIKKEYQDLENRLKDVGNFYGRQDEELYKAVSGGSNGGE